MRDATLIIKHLPQKECRIFTPSSHPRVERESRMQPCPQRNAEYSRRPQVEFSAAIRENIFGKECTMGLPVVADFFHLEGLGCFGGASMGGACLQVDKNTCRRQTVRPIGQALTVADSREYPVVRFKPRRHRPRNMRSAAAAARRGTQGFPRRRPLPVGPSQDRIPGISDLAALPAAAPLLST